MTRMGVPEARLVETAVGMKPEGDGKPLAEQDRQDDDLEAVPGYATLGLRARMIAELACS
jgi:hypothetical protein